MRAVDWPAAADDGPRRADISGRHQGGCCRRPVPAGKRRCLKAVTGSTPVPTHPRWPASGLVIGRFGLSWCGLFAELLSVSKPEITVVSRLWGEG
jgi:hypothetical protein